MASLLAKTVPIKPAFPYFDKVAVWLREPADRATLAVLKCGSLDNRIRPGPFPDLRQRLEFKQPKPEALRWLASRPDAYINQVEVALDYEFASTSERNRAYEFLDHGLVRKWHAKQQQIYLDPRIAETRYDAGRGAPSGTVLYKPGYCRFTGEPDLETAYSSIWSGVREPGGRSALPELNAGRDLVEFNHRQFWEDRFGFVRSRSGASRAMAPKQGTTRDAVGKLLWRIRKTGASRHQVTRTIAFRS